MLPLMTQDAAKPPTPPAANPLTTKGTPLGHKNWPFRYFRFLDHHVRNYDDEYVFTVTSFLTSLTPAVLLAISSAFAFFLASSTSPFKTTLPLSTSMCVPVIPSATSLAFSLVRIVASLTLSPMSLAASPAFSRRLVAPRESGLTVMSFTTRLTPSVFLAILSASSFSVAVGTVPDNVTTASFVSTPILIALVWLSAASLLFTFRVTAESSTARELQPATPMTAAIMIESTNAF